jgi:hypothetical protein
VSAQRVSPWPCTSSLTCHHRQNCTTVFIGFFLDLEPRLGLVKLPQATAPKLDFSIAGAPSSFIFRAGEDRHFSELDFSIADFLKRGGGGRSRRASSRGGAVGSRWPKVRTTNSVFGRTVRISSAKHLA